MDKLERELFMGEQSKFYEKVLDRIDLRMSKIYSDMPEMMKTQLNLVGLDAEHPIDSQALMTKLREREELIKEAKKSLIIKYIIPLFVVWIFTSFSFFYFVQQKMPIIIRKEITKVLKITEEKDGK